MWLKFVSMEDCEFNEGGNTPVLFSIVYICTAIYAVSIGTSIVPGT